jgi:two-component system C4-dicarboxylate transport response regulator DctD
MTLAEQVDAFERATIEQCLIESEGRINVAMEKLGLPRRTLTDKMSKYGLDRRRLSDNDGQKSANDPPVDGNNSPIV